MSSPKRRRFMKGLYGRAQSQTERRDRSNQRSTDERGFTLIELVIVVTVIPIIIGSLAAGLLAMFSLQSGVAARLSDSADSQAVQASFRTDVQSAARLTTAVASTPQCGTGSQLLGLEWNLNSVSHQYQNVVSYTSVPVTSGSTTTYSLVRQYCTSGDTTSPVSSTVISTNLQSGQLPPTILPAPNLASTSWILTSSVSTVTFPIAEPETNGTTSYNYTLVAAPASNTSAPDSGGPISVNTTAGCGYASTGSGTFASSLCLVDLSSLTGNNMIAARQGCVELSVPLPGGSAMYFCLGITGSPVVPAALPTWTDGFLGNSVNGIPFYSDIPGLPSLYQSCEGDSGSCLVDGSTVTNVWAGVTTITISNITVVAANGEPATGWEFVSADAESTDGGESITWTADQSLYLIPNNQSGVPANEPMGNACNTGAGIVPQDVLTGAGSSTITCNGDSNGTKTGTAMVEATMPTNMTITMVGTGLEGISLGLLF